MSRTSIRAIVCLCSLVWVALAGCESRRKVPEEETRLTKLARLYGHYERTKRKGPPPNVEALKQFGKSLSADDLKSVGLESGDLDQIFVSSRDNEPFVYRPPSKGAVPLPNAVVFYEKTGKDGKRYVAYPMGKVEEVDEAKFKELVPEAK